MERLLDPSSSLTNAWIKRKHIWILHIEDVSSFSMDKIMVEFNMDLMNDTIAMLDQVVVGNIMGK